MRYTSNEKKEACLNNRWCCSDPKIAPYQFMTDSHQSSYSIPGLTLQHPSAGTIRLTRIGQQLRASRHDNKCFSPKFWFSFYAILAPVLSFHFVKLKKVNVVWNMLFIYLFYFQNICSRIDSILNEYLHILQNTIIYKSRSVKPGIVQIKDGEKHCTT